MSNSDILEVLGQSKRRENVQPHLKKCFDNINKIKVVKVGRISPYSIYWRQSLNITKDKQI
jgi:ribosomal protein L4